MNYDTKQQFVYLLILAGIVMLPFIWGLIKEIIDDWVRNNPGHDHDDNIRDLERHRNPDRFNDYL